MTMRSSRDYQLVRNDPGSVREPVDWFRCLCNRPFAVWLDSALPHPRFGRTSILTADPTVRFEIYSTGAAALFDRVRRIKHWPCDGLKVFQQVLDESLSMAEPTPDIFRGGWIGFVGYDLKNQLERLPPPRKDPAGLPVAWFGYYPSWCVVDAATNQCALEAQLPTSHWTPRKQGLLQRSHVTPDWPWAVSDSGVRLPPLTKIARTTVWRASNFPSRAAYEAAVARIVDYIRAGDVFQVNLSQQFTLPFVGDPAALYLELRMRNPAPYAAYLKLDHERAVLSSSPELFFRVDGYRVVTRPIKGTRARLEHDEAGNQRRQAELMASEKDAAELAMIVDLERNDLGKICRPGTVTVEEAAVLETYATVYHRVATVTGQLKQRFNFAQMIHALFPGGSISGAPKIRAMEIIDELEPSPRGLYTGAIGYVGHGSHAQFNLAIRTLIVGRDTLRFNVGGGITADSDPAAEYDETLAKARGIIAALTTTRQK